MMEDEEAQAVLLQGMEGTQYITIQRTEESDGESLENQQFMTINMVTEMINGVGTEYNTATQYYETDDLLTHDMTEEDRKLAEALVAVQLEAQQKHRQINTQNQQHNDPPLPVDVSQLATLAPVSTFEIQSISSPTSQPPPPPPAYSAIQPYKRVNHNVKQEFINVKSEYDIEVSAESGEDAAPNSGQKRSLPHKKRIARKLKQQTNKKSTTTTTTATTTVVNGKKDCGKIVSQEIISLDVIREPVMHTFKCEICGNKFGGQLKFFEHLKSHYEPVKQETRIVQPTATSITITSTKNISPPSTTTTTAASTLTSTEIEEFSEPEDLMEGIRGVVEETGAHIDDENDATTVINNSSTLWAITDVTQSVNQEQIEQSSTINESDLQPDPPPSSSSSLSSVKDKTVKKKKTTITKPKKTKDDMTCPQCDRTFHHKNSLIYHLRSHTGERPHQCEVCGKSFFAASALKVHKRLHSGDKPYKCDDCGRNFRQWGDLKYHSMSIHSEQRQYQCEYCGKDFARKYSLIVHRRIHTGEKNYRCEFCNKTFRASSYLQNHRRIHTGEKPHPCDICGKPFRVRSDMKRHMQTHDRGRAADRTANNRVALITGKNNDDNNTVATDSNNKAVQELKLEVEPNSVVEIMHSEDNPESILPHEGGQNMEYTVTPTGENNSDRDPLEAVRTSDTLQYFFM